MLWKQPIASKETNRFIHKQSVSFKLKQTKHIVLQHYIARVIKDLVNHIISINYIAFEYAI